MIRLACGLLLAAALSAPAAATEFILINGDDPGEGLNDPTPRLPVADNPGETVGEQRRNALLFAADLLASRVLSTVPITVVVDFQPLGCTDENASLASAGSKQLIDDFPGQPRPDTLYPLALANSLAQEDLIPEEPDIGATFTSDLDDTVGDNVGCLNGADWYYGLDHNPPPGDLNFVSTAVHELIHGLGFASFTNLATGALVGETDEPGVFDAPDIYTRFVFDSETGKPWPAITNPERADSATNAPDVVWDGDQTSMFGAPTLTGGVQSQRVRLYAPSPLEFGSSISHWTDEVEPDDLMEPFPPSLRDVDVRAGIGLASCVLFDIGWQLASGVLCPDDSGSAVEIDRGHARFVNQLPIPSPGSNSDGGGGGGCVLAGGAFDPLWLLVVVAAGGVIRRRV